MALVNSRVPKGLPESLTVGVTELGYVATPLKSPSGAVNRSNMSEYRHPRMAGHYLRVAPMNLPGSTEVLATWPGQPPRPIDIDALLRILEQLVADATAINRRI